MLKCLGMYFSNISGEIAPVGPTSFEFVIPKEAPVTISPSVGTIMPGEVSISKKVCVKKRTCFFTCANMTRKLAQSLGLMISLH